MAWQYATYIENIATAGKAEYALPMYANAALIRPNYEPGQYNSGGPLPHSMDIWRAGAPSLDFLSPDIYFNEFAHSAAEYTRTDNPLFIPEAQGGRRVRRMFFMPWDVKRLSAFRRLVWMTRETRHLTWWALRILPSTRTATCWARCI